MRNKKHACALDLQSYTMLPKSKWPVLCPAVCQACLVSQHHPATYRHFRSYPALMAERHRQLSEGDAYVIHPFSCFRLNRQLQALSMTKYGSVDSGLNRAGLAPGTNKHAVEGSNPIWNEAIKAPDFDAISDTSGDSDLIGIEDLPQFRDDYFPPGDSDSLSGILMNQDKAPVATHGNNFGFRSTPYLPK